ncbi:hypothetical protein E4T39_08864 [Aureobasidium subglaciale]|nr:hypothetical protein E4T39_08864 [Aureobasidium subglaciale]
MSDNESATKGESPVKAGKKIVTFTDKEELVLKAAWRCLKSGPPEVDMEKLTKAAGFNTLKTAANTWGVIKKKLFADVDGITTPSAPGSPSTPKEPKTAKAKKRTKKRTKKAAEDDDEDEDEGRSIPAKRKKPSPVKKTIKSEDSDDE